MLGRAVLLAVAMVVISPAGAPAQFTSVITQPKKAEPAATVTTTAGGAATDTARVAQMADMRAWVDSAAGALGVATQSPADTTAVVTAHAADTHTTVSTGDVGSMSTGVRAPDTASTVPLIALLGAVVLSVGTFLLSTRPRRIEKQVTMPPRA